MVDALTLSSIAQIIGVPLWSLTLLLIWSLFWKAVALWKSARLNQSVWFIILLLINTAGILEILYIFLFSEIKLPIVEKPKRQRSKKRNKRVKSKR